MTNTATTPTASRAPLTETLDLGNNDVRSRGIFAQPDGTFLALLFITSRTFKTRKAAERWMVSKTGKTGW